MLIEDLGQLPYRDAWALQEQAHEQVQVGAQERIFLVEHPPVITYGRRPGVERNLLATPERLERRGVEIVQSDRGGDITFHGPGQLVAYPIIRLASHGFSVGGYVHTLEAAVIATLAEFNIAASADPAAVGVWTPDRGVSSKICAIGVRIRRGVSLHGVALNVNCDLSFFDLIVPCGLSGRRVTSLQQVLAQATPKMERVKELLGKHLLIALNRTDAHQSRQTHD
ncbi:MAG TPA: lipoyl(octanoyl) transferase LipB [Tepidisphaeraceae bacterium]|jgi:lipoyl(octanoyl) transferase|nr:lipoyl(octanoyl) transferase LipB [Tepidisphaeraceae bacterium]